jgi:ligand-binding sensor protein
VLEATVRDHGQGFDVSLFDPDELPDLMAEGGRGLFLMSRLMDVLDLELEEGLLVRMRLRGSRDAETPAYSLADLIDVPRLQALLDSMHEAFDCPTAIIDNEARVLTATAWQEACTRFHRLNAETRELCEESDLHIYGQLGQGSDAVSYVCPRGMIDCAAPIRIQGRHLGNVFIGQVFVDPPDLEAYRLDARRFGFDEDAYLEAVARVPVIGREELQRRLPFVRALAEMIAELGLSRLREKEMPYGP